MKIHLIIYVTIISLVLFLFMLSCNEKRIKQSKICFYKCPKYDINKVLKELFKQNDIIRTEDPYNCNLYMPCGYNNVENELKNLHLDIVDLKIYAISGCDRIVSKNFLWQILEHTYTRKYAKQLMPDTFIISQQQDMDLFKQTYSRDTLYFLKKNLQRKKGIFISNNLEEILQEKDNGYKIIQKELSELYLINGRKINLRLYLLIICHQNEVKFYLHKHGKCIYTNKVYADDKLDLESHLTSLNMSKKLYDTLPHTLEDLKEYLRPEDNLLLFNNIYINLKIILKACKPYLNNLNNLKKHTCFQLFGLDYLFNKEMYPFLLEMNKGPDMNPINFTDKILKKLILRDTFHLVDIIKDSQIINNFIEIYNN